MVPAYARRVVRVAIVGGGASGTLAAVALHRVPGVQVTVVERAERAGPGLAYGAAQEHHLLNSPAGRMGAAEADGFTAWCAKRGEPVDPGAFVSRRRYGDYLSNVLAALPVTVLRGEATALDPGGRLHLSDGRTVEADHVVLALGNPPPRGADPWAAEVPAGARRVLLVGTGLTMVDIATTLARRDPGVRIVAMSRSLLLPRVHLDAPAPPGPGIHPDGSGLDAVVAAFRKRLRAGERPWQAEVDGIRPQVNALWSGLPAADRVRFVARISRRWEVLRHRMAPSVAGEVASLRDSGTLALRRDPAPEAADVVLDCSGPRPPADRGWNPLVDDLLDRGLVRPDPLGVGMAVDARGRAIGADGRSMDHLSVVGPARRGSEWECTAVPEIREQARALAETLLPDP